MKMTNEKRQALIEWLESQRDACDEIHADNCTREQCVTNRIALAALTAEPVKVPDEPTGGDAPCHLDEYEGYCWVAGARWMRGKILSRLNAIDNTAQQYEALARWKMVPIEPSKEMRSQIHPIADGICSHCGNRTTLDCEENMLLSWRDMLAAAPKPEV